jgi:hypothetical protein
MQDRSAILIECTARLALAQVADCKCCSGQRLKLVRLGSANTGADTRWQGRAWHQLVLVLDPVRRVLVLDPF